MRSKYRGRVRGKGTRRRRTKRLKYYYVSRGGVRL